MNEFEYGQAPQFVLCNRYYYQNEIMNEMMDRTDVYYWNWFECVVGGVRHPQHTQISSNSSTIATDNNTL